MAEMKSDVVADEEQGEGGEICLPVRELRHSKL